MKKGLYIIALLSYVVLSCSEKLDPQPNDYSKAFTSDVRKGWQIRSIQLLEDGKGTQSFGLPQCLADDIYFFYAGIEKSFEISNGNTKCSAEEPDIIISDTWEFSNANATMNIILPLFADFKLPYFVREVDETEMELEIFLDDENTSSYRINFRAVDEE
jgi:hypothetical protein